MSAFGNAFKAARASGAKTFDFNGKSYTTKTADDLKGKVDPDYGKGTKVTQNNLDAANASSDPIAALNSQKQWTDPPAEFSAIRGGQGAQGYANGGVIKKAPTKPIPASFENSGMDKEVPGTGKEGSKREEMFDRKQMAAPAAKVPNPVFQPFGRKPGAKPA